MDSAWGQFLEDIDFIEESDLAHYTALSKQAEHAESLGRRLRENAEARGWPVTRLTSQ